MKKLKIAKMKKEYQNKKLLSFISFLIFFILCFCKFDFKIVFAALVWGARNGNVGAVNLLLAHRDCHPEKSRFDQAKQVLISILYF